MAPRQPGRNNKIWRAVGRYQIMRVRVRVHSVKCKLVMNATKTKIMELDKWQGNTTVKIDVKQIKQVKCFQIEQCVRQLATELRAFGKGWQLQYKR